MSYSAVLNDNNRMLVHGSNEAPVLYDAIYHVTRNGEDVHVVNERDETVWYVEADTKVDDDDPTFPAIVHNRTS